MNIYKTRTKKKKNYKLKIKKITGLIKLKAFSLYISNLIKKYFFYFFYIKINHVLLQKGIMFKYKLLNKNHLDSILLFKTLVLSIIYNNTIILGNYLTGIITMAKNHKKTLSEFIFLLDSFYFTNIIKLVGLQLKLNGKLSGKMRTSKYKYKIGKVQLQSLNIKLNYHLGISYTKFGIIGVKVWLLNGNS